MKFIHTADLHLDSPFEGLKKIPDNFSKQLYKASMTAFDEMIKDAINKKVDFILIAGDLYDNPHPSVTAQLFLQKEFTKLKQFGIPVYLCLGNHDFLDLEKTKLVYPENVYVFPNKVVTKEFFADGQPVSLTSFSYGKQWVKCQTSYFPIKGSEKWHLGMLHGEVSSNFEEAKYAPFSLSQLKSKNYDYWALGHIHKREILSEDPWIVYSGNIQGKNIKEIGVKGYYLVEEQEGQLVPNFCPLTGIQWVETVLGFEKEDTFEQLKTKVETKLIDIKKATPSARAFVMRIILKAPLDFDSSLKERIIKGVLLGQVQSDMQDDHSLFLYDIAINTVRSQQKNFWDIDTEKEAANLVFQETTLYRLADNLVKYRFIDEHFAQPSIAKSIKNKSRAYLEEEMDGE
ncbi:metallophosphoesterase [Liquorilactobacillus aquaticus DSM 21051]|uniref:Metallophosphoesterase n=1 Tax=Liquorilactobacillus aquaticus DSM 21051 TaxID=1423725 RepID=A0A0R2D411_9LACO|nr:DNA repair exonuclease [Liquorilactobacillus aquaticus]KRM96644.1 metallophosphoesterase [Liquorilactobacillus aquaticus DSM 21051]